MKYVLYARVSPRGSDFEGETTISMQLQYCRDYVKFHGGEVVGEYFDEFSSGKDTHRPQFSLIMKELEKGTAEWDAMIVYKLSRMTRSLRDGVNIFAELFRQGKGFVSATENLDFSSPAGRAMLGMMQVFNQFEREQGGENVRNKMLSIARRGEWPIGRPPFGYKRSGIRHDNVLLVDDVNGAIVKDIFFMYLQSGRSTVDIRKKYPHIARSKIFSILRDPVYLGKIPISGHVYDGKHPPLISYDDFEKAQSRLPHKAASVRPAAYKHYNFLLSGLLRCSCGSKMVAGTAKSGRYAYYTCVNHDCRKRIAAKGIEDDALQAIRRIHIDDTVIDSVVTEIQRRQAEDQKRVRPDLERLRGIKSTLEADKQKLVDLLLGNKLHPAFVDDLNVKMDKLTAELSAVESELNAFSSFFLDRSDLYSIAWIFAKQVKEMQDALSTSLTADTLRRALILHIKEIELQSSGKWKIIPNYESSTKSPKWWV